MRVGGGATVETGNVILIISEAIDFTGVAIIAFGAVASVARFVHDLTQQVAGVTAYGRLRTFLGRSLLLGLEFLVAGDIIKTVAVEPTFNSVIVLAIIVLVRTVLSISIDVEIDGRWPWQAAEQEAQSGGGQPGYAGTDPAHPGQDHGER
jgi:uncharacterized membrane protein